MTATAIQTTADPAATMPKLPGGIRWARTISEPYAAIWAITCAPVIHEAAATTPRPLTAPGGGPAASTEARLAPTNDRIPGSNRDHAYAERHGERQALHEVPAPEPRLQHEPVGP